MSEPFDYEYLLRVALVGDCKVGKSTLLSQFTEGKSLVDYRATIGVEFRAINTKIGGANVKVQIWDTSGQERFRFITKAYYRGLGGAIVVYDVANHSSYINVARWIKDLRENMNLGTPILLVGNKSDLSQLREVTTEEATNFAAAEGLDFMETSALDGSNVETAFRAVLGDVLSITSGRYFQEPYLIQPSQGKEI
ncbi:hypothetical protein M408DRAFT_295076 [Serendipita vermifera MAFF 305830]|uniref:Uncharacterized protein n=1 Tax=Serendipita vermifera MAFF 305830 TaxID=933852 RepID=A0A0C3B0B1_SERVB|nr:hypothetical protein M408DRAFT_295076 [Serendipita vermifera MAFF 305830]